MRWLLLIALLLAPRAFAQQCVLNAQCVGADAVWQHDLQIRSQSSLSPAYEWQTTITLPMVEVAFPVLWRMWAEEYGLNIVTESRFPDGSFPPFYLAVQHPFQAAAHEWTGNVDSILGSSVNDWEGACDTQGEWLRVNPSGNFTITGAATETGCTYTVGNGRRVTIQNVSASNSITLSDESGSSLAQHRFALRGDLTLPPAASVQLVYDGTSLRWRPVGADVNTPAAAPTDLTQIEAPPGDDYVPVSDSASASTWRQLTDSDGATQCLQYDQATNTFSAGTHVGASVETAEITDANVTYAKIQNVTASRLLGRGDSGAGAPQEITLGTNLSMSGTTLNAASGGGAGNSVEVSLALSGGSGFFSTTVTGQSWVTSGSEILCSPFGTTEDGLTPEAVAVGGLVASVSDRVVSTGFNLNVFSPHGLEGTVRFHCVGV